MTSKYDIMNCENIEDYLRVYTADFSKTNYMEEIRFHGRWNAIEQTV